MQLVIWQRKVSGELILITIINKDEAEEHHHKRTFHVKNSC